MCCHWLKLKGAASVCKEEGYLNVHVHKNLIPQLLLSNLEESAFFLGDIGIKDRGP